jgi:hypothetical protein
MVFCSIENTDKFTGFQSGKIYREMSGFSGQKEQPECKSFVK